VIRRSRHAQQFVTIPNYIAQDNGLSFAARGLLTYLLSLPPDWRVTTDGLARANPDSRDRIRKAMAELRDTGYVALVTERGSDGRTRRHLEVSDVPAPSAVRPALGATRANNVFPLVAPNAGKPAVGIPAVTYKDGDKTRARARAREAPAPASLPGPVTCHRCGSKSHETEACPA